MLLQVTGTEPKGLSPEELREGLQEAFRALGPRRRILIIPPDITRIHSMAGQITRMAYDHYGTAVSDILPALGTHRPMTAGQIDTMFPGVPHGLFRVHDWRNDVVRIGEIPGETLSELSGGALKFSLPVELNRLVWEGGHDLILSIGQVVPHEVIGMAGYNKNLLIGCGGPGSINRSHFLGAVYGMERIMGIADNPVRRLLNLAASMHLARLPLVYILTVIGTGEGSGIRGLFVGTDEEVFFAAAGLSARVNITRVERPIAKAVVWLDPTEYRSTWLGNKAVYRTRMAMADGGELIILAPGVKEFGEDPAIDRLIRKHGYRGTPATLAAVAQDPELAGNLSAAAHLIHGSSEGRFRITWCPGGISREEVLDAGYGYGELAEMMKAYNPDNLIDGYNPAGPGEAVFFIRNPAMGLWMYQPANQI